MKQTLVTIVEMIYNTAIVRQQKIKNQILTIRDKKSDGGMQTFYLFIAKECFVYDNFSSFYP